jgi:hypothetical protein
MAVAIKAGEPVLHNAVRNLAVLRYIHQAIPATDSWHFVFARYISQLGDQVKGLGVDPILIQPSPDDPGLPGDPHQEKPIWRTGKVCEVVFDCFGDFEGFVLESCEERHRFRSNEKGIATLALKACRDRLLISICVKEQRGKERICELVVLAG